MYSLDGRSESVYTLCCKASSDQDVMDPVEGVTKENRISDQFIIRFITSLGSYESHEGAIHEGACSFMNRHPFPLVHINNVVQTINLYNNSFPQFILSALLLTTEGKPEEEVHNYKMRFLQRKLLQQNINCGNMKICCDILVIATNV